MRVFTLLLSMQLITQKNKPVVPSTKILRAKIISTRIRMNLRLNANTFFYVKPEELLLSVTSDSKEQRRS